MAREFEQESMIKTKSELINELKTYKKILSGDLYSYIKSLIQLNNSSLENKFSKEELPIIENIPVFDDITLYNIYYLAKEYINNHPEVTVDEQINNIKLHDSSYMKGNLLFDLYFSQSYDTRRQEVNFYSEVNDQKHFELLDDQVSKELQYEYTKTNPYGYVAGKYGGPASHWQFEHEKKIEKLERELQDIRGRNIPNEEEKEHIKLMQDYNKSLMEYFKVDESAFKEEVKFGSNKIRKVLGQKVNGIKVYNNIRYM